MQFKKLIEVFLFVNPLSADSYEASQTILNFSEERDEKVKVRFLPLLNFHTIGTHMTEEKIEGASLEMRNKLYTESYHVCLAFQAAAMQGQKKGRQFLLALQEEIIEFQKDVSKSTVMEVADQVKLDIEIFEEDLGSELSKNAFTKDQKLAQEMAIKDAPSCVIFHGSDGDHGYRIQSNFTKQLLHGLCKTELNNQQVENTKNKYTFQTV